MFCPPLDLDFGTASNTVVTGSNGFQYVESGGTGVNAVVGGRGAQYIATGGTESGTIVSSGGVQSGFGTDSGTSIRL